MKDSQTFRKSTQQLLPPSVPENKKGTYNLYPTYPIGKGFIQLGYDSIAKQLSTYSTCVIDGYIGVFWEHFRHKVEAALKELGYTSTWIDISECLLPEESIHKHKSPFLGGDDPVFGTRYKGSITDFYDTQKIKNIDPTAEHDLCIVYGCGAALVDWDSPTVYIDLPKNEIQYRSRAGSITNFGRSSSFDPKKMYKEFYFVDWIVLNEHKKRLVDKIDVIIDEQRPNQPVIMKGEDFRFALEQMSENVFRVRPWFEPGVWGGQWCKNYIPELPGEVPNYAWSFEMIVPENGLVLSSENVMLEFSFDWLMYAHNENILGQCADIFGYEFPVRFDFLDTFDGENLSLQCHPRPEYIKENFGENFTQDETYYILDCEKDANVYLGFKEDIEPDQFKNELEEGAQNGSKVDVENYVLTHSAQKHDLFLIPSGTIHCSGKNNLVLEISSTPYIFTFKMYDWQRLDLDGNPRPINIDRAFENLKFERKGRAKIEKEFISEPTCIDSGATWKLIQMPTHPEHFYNVYRYELETEKTIETRGSFHVLNLVEGTSVLVETSNGVIRQFNYAETFTIPAATKWYKIINDSDLRQVKVVMASMKTDISI